MALGVYGKHPAKGDFIAHGLPPALQARLEVWLDATLAEAKEALGPVWPAVWPAAPPLHFWLGEGIWGEPVAGLMAPAQDRVGRRFPLVFLATGADAPPPPVIDAAQDWHQALSAHAVAQLLRRDLDHPGDLLNAMPHPAVAEGIAEPSPSDFWATRPGPEVGTLWQDVALADHRRAAAGRSYWWVVGVDAPAAADVLVFPPTPLPDDMPPPPDEADVWALSGVAADDESSPFAGAVPGMFAPPALPEALVETEMPEPALQEPQPSARRDRTPDPRQAQIWAGAGLPSGKVLAWFFKGHADKDQSDLDQSDVG
jgi:type VI secretion system ImpM family protein